MWLIDDHQWDHTHSPKLCSITLVLAYASTTFSRAPYTCVWQQCQVSIQTSISPILNNHDVTNGQGHGKVSQSGMANATKHVKAVHVL